MEAQETDNVNMWLQTTGYGTKALDTSVLYIDSMWLSSSDPTTISQTDEVTFSVANNATDISKSQKQYAFTANKAFAYGIGNLNDYTEVKINGTVLTAGTDYTVPVSYTHLSTYVYRKGLLEQNYSFSTAVGLFNSIISFILLIGANTLSKRCGEGSLW